MTTPYHARYFAHELTRIGGEGVDRLSRSLFDACWQPEDMGSNLYP